MPSRGKEVEEEEDHGDGTRDQYEQGKEEKGQAVLDSLSVGFDESAAPEEFDDTQYGYAADNDSNPDSSFNHLDIAAMRLVAGASSRIKPSGVRS